VPKPVDKILAAAATPGGSLLVSDEEREAILRYDAKGQYLGTFPVKDAARRKVTRIVVDGEGGIVTLDREEKAVRVWTRRAPLARGRPGGPQAAGGRRGGRLPQPVRGGRGARGPRLRSPGPAPHHDREPELQRPRALALDATGAVLVYDDRAERVLRYR